MRNKNKTNTQVDKTQPELDMISKLMAENEMLKKRLQEAAQIVNQVNIGQRQLEIQRLDMLINFYSLISNRSDKLSQELAGKYLKEIDSLFFPETETIIE